MAMNPFDKFMVRMIKVWRPFVVKRSRNNPIDILIDAVVKQ